MRFPGPLSLEITCVQNAVMREPAFTTRRITLIKGGCYMFSFDFVNAAHLPGYDEHLSPARQRMGRVSSVRIPLHHHRKQIKQISQATSKRRNKQQTN